MSGQCEMVIGFLVPHRCENRAVAACGRCGRNYCETHVAIEHGGLLCAACKQGLDEPILVAKTAERFDEEDIKIFSQSIFDDDGDDLFSDLS